MLTIDDAVLDEQKQFASYRLTMFKQNKKDLVYLLQAHRIRLDSIQTPKYQKEYLQFKEKLNELETRFKQAKNTYDRNKILFQKSVIAKAEFEQVEFDYNLALSNIYQLKEQQRNTWQASLSELEIELEKIENDKRQVSENQNQFVITAPVSGTLLNVQGIERGSYINAGSVLAEISPDTDLLVECYVNPMDIGLIRKDRKVTFQIDAFNYNLWGLATGEIIEISDDIEMLDNQPVFKIRCKIHQTHLKLKNGTIGKLGKGMTLRARFELAERSLFDLLYDKMDDWLNPANKKVVQN
ncbi:MAG: HlyD family efflux transporter periplasmic adaptor subunit [Flavobacteriaceae bacterium]|nr:HlyD family efflux transporter periplasmic adaptor subunit [Flavobacteriaceae bacterium]